MSNRCIWPGFRPSEEDIAEAAGASPKVLLAFSCGKDAIASWLALRGAGVAVVPYYMYLVPDLAFVESSLRYYEEFFGQRIMRLPSPSFYRLLNNLVFQPPGRIETIQDLRLPSFTDQDLRDEICKTHGLPLDTWRAIGVRANDSLPRRMGIKALGGGLNRKKRILYPVWDWTKAGVEEAIREAGVKLPVDYSLFGRSFDGIDYRFLRPIRDHFPADYQRILDWFPLSEVELLREQYAHAQAA